jgi:quinone-modifying oxidoreductase subunit QmoB
MQQDPGIFLTKGEVTRCFQKRRRPGGGSRNTLLGEKIQVKADLVVLGAGMVPVTKDDPVVNLAYRQGPGLPGHRSVQRLCGFQLHLLPLRNPADRHLRGRRHPPFHDRGRVHRRRFRCGPQGHPVPGVGQPRCVRASALRRHDLPGFLLPALHPVQALHRGVSLRRPGRRRKGNAQTQSHPLPPLRHLHGCLPRAHHRICRLQHRQHRLHGQIHRRAVRRRLHEPPLRILGLVCENDAYPALDMAGLNRLATRRMCASSRSAAWVR